MPNKTLSGSPNKLATIYYIDALVFTVIAKKATLTVPVSFCEMGPTQSNIRI
jgi:hypothetical protein